MRENILNHLSSIIVIPFVLSSPIKDPVGLNIEIPKCYLPQDLTPTSGIKFLEDCDSIGKFNL